MDWSQATWWWIATGVLVAVELATGTFYLLMLAVGTLAGALAAHAGLGFTGQLAAGAVIGGGATAAWHLRRSHRSASRSEDGNRDLNLDVGERVTVLHWQPDGSAQVSYRGASWSARFAGSGTPQPGSYVIRAVEGNRLMLDRLPA